MSSIFDRETTRQAFKDAAWIAEHGTREEKSGRFLPPPGWKGTLVTADTLPEPRTPEAA